MGLFDQTNADSSQTDGKYQGFVNENGLKQGWGRMTWSNDNWYEGEWRDDKHQGFGKKVSQDNT